MLVAEHRPSGLIAARDSMDEASVSGALKRLDGRLCLQKHPCDGVAGGWVYKVICLVSDTHAPVVFTWADDHGRPLPLSSGLVDAVGERLAGSRNKPLSEDEWNTRLLKEKHRDADREAQAIVDDHWPYIERDRTTVSLSDTGKKRYWQRKAISTSKRRSTRG